MPNWHWLLDPLVLACGGLSIAVLMNIWCFFYHRRLQKKHPSEPMPVRTLVKNHLFASTILTVCVMGILYAFCGLWTWTGSFLIALAIWIVPIGVLLTLASILARKLPAADSERVRQTLTVETFAIAIFIGSPFILTYSLFVIVHARLATTDWESFRLSMSRAFEDACDYVCYFLENCCRAITNAVAFLTNARYWLFSSLFSWFTGIKTPPNYRQYN